MSKHTHTPGPWHIVLREGPGHIKAKVCWSDDGECITDWVYEIADAQLMAAAPDLLEALEDLVALFNRGNIGNGVHVTMADMSDAKEIIAKAIGEVAQ